MIRSPDLKIRLAITTGIASFVLSAGPVVAAELVTPPLLAPTSQQRLVCIATNVDAKPGAITVTIVATGDGSIAATTTCDAVESAGTCAATASGALTGYCKITAKKKTRGALWLQDAAHDGIPITSLPATK